MEVQTSYTSLYQRRNQFKNKAAGVRWVKEWVPQELASTGGRCLVLKWVREDMLNILKERSKESASEEREPEPTTEVLFLCSFEGCGKTFVDAGALRKHAHIHGERQHICQYEGCGKKFLDSSKLKRHHLIHTGQKDFVCPQEGCGKAFSLDFNLRAHMRTHTQENYHICPYVDCGKRYAHDYKLQAHIKSCHTKNAAINAMKQAPPAEKPRSFPKTPTIYGPASSERPYACHYEGCGKAYIHEYKLNLHLKREHPGHKPDTNPCNLMAEHNVNGACGQDTNVGRGCLQTTCETSKYDLDRKLSISKFLQKDSVPSVSAIIGKQLWHPRHVHDEDSEETEEDNENTDNGWPYRDGNDDDEETEDED